MELEPSAIDALLSRWPVARLVTLRPDGAPAPVPVVFARVGGALYSPIDGKPKSPGVLARERHLADDPRVALLLDHYEEDWDRLWWLRVEGRAIVVSAADHEAALHALRGKYPQYARVALTSGDPRLLRIAIERVTGWRASARAGI
jgi:PPOX class probable F420-dependent enzyme